jgi:FkbM family methyltransferase
MARTLEAFPVAFSRYISNGGSYPWTCRVRTPIGRRSVNLFSYHDLLTINEVFCRQDYPVDSDARVIVDLGANIGISGLYFLTRNSGTRCYLFEPVPRNVERLRANLAGLEDRFEIHEEAVADRAGQLEFGVEDIGRYGGLGANTGQSITVTCRHINDVLAAILEKEERIDLVKIDTEGEEARTVAAIDPKLFARIGKIVYEYSVDGQPAVVRVATGQSSSVQASSSAVSGAAAR